MTFCSVMLSSLLFIVECVNVSVPTSVSSAEESKHDLSVSFWDTAWLCCLWLTLSNASVTFYRPMLGIGILLWCVKLSLHIMNCIVSLTRFRICTPDGVTNGDLQGPVTTHISWVFAWDLVIILLSRLLTCMFFYAGHGSENILW